MRPGPDGLPRSIAIAGAWGYIGRKFLEVALDRGLTTFVHDPGPIPTDLDPSRFTRVEDEAGFDRLDADLFHLAVHPEHRRLGPLLGRAHPPTILVEKPMAEPERPEVCRAILDAVGRSKAVVLYDFPELYDPITSEILAYLASFREVSVTEFHVRRSKDREDPGNPRNAKRMVPIQYQEAVHCLAFVLQILGATRGGAREALADGLRLEAESAAYAPPNPEAYPYVVDGRCRYRMTIGETRVAGLTDFKRGAPWAKSRVIRGVGDGRAFEVEASYLEGAKSLRIDGRDRGVDPSASSYEAVLSTLARWSVESDRDRLMSGPFPNPGFARLTYQLSGALWRSSRDGSGLAFRDADELESFDPGFYGSPSGGGRS